MKATDESQHVTTAAKPEGACSAQCKPLSTLPVPLQDEDTVIHWIAELTNKPEEVVRRQLREEYEQPGTCVRRATEQQGIPFYQWTERLAQFYSQTDAFLFELVIWNMNRRKRRMRRWIVKHLARHHPGRLNILVVGDGLGFDSAYLALAGHAVTYFEYPGFSERFARKVFDLHGLKISIITDPGGLSQNHFDAVVCLDVLEHVNNPPEFVGTLAGYLRPGGYLVVHAPFYMIHPSTPTHLKSNRRYSGSLRLFRQHGLCLIDGDPCWAPVMFAKSPEGGLWSDRLSLKMLGLRFAGFCLLPGRLTVLPYLWVLSYRRKTTRWFGEG